MSKSNWFVVSLMAYAGIGVILADLKVYTYTWHYWAIFTCVVVIDLVSHTRALMRN